jgi:hypothetical protein
MSRFDYPMRLFVLGCLGCAPASAPPSAKPSNVAPSAGPSGAQGAASDARFAKAASMVDPTTADVVAASLAELRNAIALGRKEFVVQRITFPFHDHRRGEPYSKEELLQAFDQVFSQGIRKQLISGTPRSITRAEVDELREDSDDLCGDEGEVVLESAAEPDSNDPDEAFWHLILRKQGSTLVIDRIIGCS